MTQIYYLPFQLLKALSTNCNKPAQLTPNKPALCPLLLPAPLRQPQPVSNTRLGQTRAGTLCPQGQPSLVVLQRAGFSCPGIQLPSLEWAPRTGWALTTQGRFYHSRDERRERVVMELPFPRPLRRRGVGIGKRGAQCLLGTGLGPPKARRASFISSALRAHSESEHQPDAEPNLPISSEPLQGKKKVRERKSRGGAGEYYKETTFLTLGS